MKSDSRLEEFRSIIRIAYSAKGITPPEEDSMKERELYQRWLIKIQNEISSS